MTYIIIALMIVTSVSVILEAYGSLQAMPRTRFVSYTVR